MSGKVLRDKNVLAMKTAQQAISRHESFRDAALKVGLTEVLVGAAGCILRYGSDEDKKNGWDGESITSIVRKIKNQGAERARRKYAIEVKSKDSIRGEKSRHSGYLWRQVNETLTNLCEMPLASDVVQDMALHFDVENKLPVKIETAIKWLTEFRNAYHLSPRSQRRIPASSHHPGAGNGIQENILAES